MATDTRVEAVEGLIEPALKALGVPNAELVFGRYNGKLMVGFCGCAIGFGDGEFFLAATSNDIELSERNTETLLGLFTEKFGKPVPWEEGGHPVWWIDVDTSYIELHLGLMGYELMEDSVCPMIH